MAEKLIWKAYNGVEILVILQFFLILENHSLRWINENIAQNKIFIFPVVLGSTLLFPKFRGSEGLKVGGSACITYTGPICQELVDRTALPINTACLYVGTCTTIYNHIQSCSPNANARENQRWPIVESSHGGFRSSCANSRILYSYFNEFEVKQIFKRNESKSSMPLLQGSAWNSNLPLMSSLFSLSCL